MGPQALLDFQKKGVGSREWNVFQRPPYQVICCGKADFSKWPLFQICVTILTSEKCKLWNTDLKILETYSTGIFWPSIFMTFSWIGHGTGSRFGLLFWFLFNSLLSSLFSSLKKRRISRCINPDSLCTLVPLYSG